MRLRRRDSESRRRAPWYALYAGFTIFGPFIYARSCGDWDAAAFTFAGLAVMGLVHVLFTVDWD